MKPSITIILISITIQAVGQNFQFQYDSISSKIYYENIIPFPGLDKATILERSKKFLSINQYPLRYEDETEVYATGLLEADYTTKFLVFHNDHDDRYIYDIIISIKDNKLRYRNINFYVIPNDAKLHTRSWFSNPKQIGSFGWSTTKIPTKVPKRPIEDFYKGSDSQNKLFYNVDILMKTFEDDLKKMVEKKEEDW